MSVRRSPHTSREWLGWLALAVVLGAFSGTLWALLSR